MGRQVALIESGNPRTFRIFDIDLGTTVTFPRQGSSIAGLSYIDNDEWLVAVASSGALERFNSLSKTRTPLPLIGVPSGELVRGKSLVFGKLTSSPYIWGYDISNGVASHLVVPGVSSRPTSIAVSPDDKWLVLSKSGSPNFIVWDIGEGVVVSGPETTASVQPSGFAFSPDSSFLLTWYNSSPYATLYRTADWSAVPLTLPSPRSPAAATFSADGNKLFLVQQNLLYVAESFAEGVIFDQVSGVGAIGGGGFIGALGDLLFFDTSEGVFALGVENLSLVDTPSLAIEGAAAGGATRMPQSNRIFGSVRDSDGLPASRLIRAHLRSSGLLCAEALSDPVTGDFSMLVFEGDVEYDLQFLAEEGEELNDLIFARTVSLPL